MHLLSAIPCDWPRCIPRPLAKRRRDRAQGLVYERRLAEAVQRTGAVAHHGQWYEYRRADEPTRMRYCQPDIVMPLAGRVVVLECKLGDVDGAERQIRDLYRPVLGAHYGCPVEGIIVTRHVTRAGGRRIVGSLGEALAACAEGHIPVLHWLGRGRI